MKRILFGALVALVLTGCVPEEIEVDTSKAFHLCTTKQAVDRLLNSTLYDNYFLMINSIDAMAERLNCPAYRLKEKITVTVLSTELIPQGPFSELVLAEISDSNLGVRYTSYFVNRRTGMASGALIEIVEQRTENGINDFFNGILE